MSEGLSDADIERIAEAIVKAESKCTSPQSFHVDAKAHYNSHARLDRLLDAYDSASNIVIRSFIGLLLVGIVAAIAIGTGMNK